MNLSDVIFLNKIPCIAGPTLAHSPFKTLIYVRMQHWKILKQIKTHQIFLCFLDRKYTTEKKHVIKKFLTIVFSQCLSVSDTRKKWFLRASEIERKKKVNCVSCEKGKKL
jgi:hypothetical protein